MVLALTLHNGDTGNLVVGGSVFEESSFHLAITDDAGRAVQHTALGERVLTPPTVVSANSTVRLGAGRSLRYRFNLARLFDLSQTGTYTVRVSRVVRQSPLPFTALDQSQPEVTLTAGPLKMSVVEAADAESGPTALTHLPDHGTFFYVADENYSHWTDWTAAGVYVSNVSVIKCFRVGPDGSVFSTLNVPVPVEKGTGSVAATPDGRFLYAGGESGIAQFRVGADGMLLPLSPPVIPTQKFPGPLLMDPKGRFLCVSSRDSTAVYAVGRNGCLTVTATMPFTESAEHQNASVVPGSNGVLDSTGRFFYADNGAAVGFRLDAAGRVKTALGTQRIEEEQFDNGLSLGQPSSAIALTPSGRFAYVLGLKWIGPPGHVTARSEDVLIPMRVRPDGTLDPLPEPTIFGGQNGIDYGYTNLSVDPTGHVLLVLNSVQDFIAPYQIKPDGFLSVLKILPLHSSPLMLFFVPGSSLVYVSSLNSAGLLAFQFDAHLGLTPAAVDTPTSGIPYINSCAAAVAQTPLKRGSTTGGLQISLWLAGDVQSADKPLALTVVLKNDTVYPLRLGGSGSDMTSFHLKVAGPQRQSPSGLRDGGEPVAAAIPLLAAGHDLLNLAGSSTAPVVLPSGGQRQYRFVLSRLADLTVAGNYTVQITRTLPGGRVVASPVVPFLLDGPFDGRIRNDKYSVEIL